MPKIKRTPGTKLQKFGFRCGSWKAVEGREPFGAGVRTSHVRACVAPTHVCSARIQKTWGKEWAYSVTSRMRGGASGIGKVMSTRSTLALAKREADHEIKSCIQSNQGWRSKNALAGAKRKKRKR